MSLRFIQAGLHQDFNSGHIWALSLQFFASCQACWAVTLVSSAEAWMRITSALHCFLFLSPFHIDHFWHFWMFSFASLCGGSAYNSRFWCSSLNSTGISSPPAHWTVTLCRPQNTSSSTRWGIAEDNQAWFLLPQFITQLLPSWTPVTRWHHFSDQEVPSFFVVVDNFDLVHNNSSASLIPCPLPNESKNVRRLEW